MGGSITWRGGANGAWTSGQNWSVFQVPGLADDVGIGAGDSVDIAPGVLAQAGALALPGGLLLLDIGAVLRVAGIIAPHGGTLAIAGTLAGGTLAPGGTVLGQGGTLDGTTVRAGVAGLGGVTITPATAAASAAIAPAGTLTLAAGRYDAATFSLTQAGAGLDAGGGGTVLLGATTTVAGSGATVLGGGTLTNTGTIALAPATQVVTQTIYQPVGKFGALIGAPLTWTQAMAPTLDIAAARFVTTGLIAVAGGTLDVSGASVRNTGTIRLDDASAQTVTADASGMVSVVATTLATRVEVQAGVTDFTNTGTIAADSIRFDGGVQLARLGTLAGAVTFAGALDLGGRTLTATTERPVIIAGSVAHGTLLAGMGAAGMGALTLAGATLSGAILGGGTAEATGTLHLCGLGALTLEAGAVLSVTGAVTLLGAYGDAIHDNGSIVATAGATLRLQAGLGGAGTVELSDNAAVSVASVALLARPRFQFDAGASLLTLTGQSAGITLAGLHAGDVLDLTGIAAAGGQGSAEVVGGMLDVVGGSGQSALFALAAPAHGIGFTVGADGHGGTLVTVV